jgi:hypothetical protein
LLSDSDEQLIMRKDGKLPVFAVSLHAFPPVSKPIRQREIDCFVEVELARNVSTKLSYESGTDSVIETRMIRLGAGYNEFARTLVASIYADTGVGHSLGVHERNELEQQVRLRLEKIGSLAFNGSFKLLSVGPWDTVPGFGFTPVHLRKIVNLWDERKCETRLLKLIL